MEIQLEHYINGKQVIPFDLAKAKTPENPDGLEVVTGLGDKVRIICTNLDYNDEYPIVGTYLDEQYKSIQFRTFTKDGVFFPPSSCSDSNLFLVVKQVEHWVNVMERSPYNNKKKAFVYEDEKTAYEDASKLAKTYGCEVKTMRIKQIED